MTSGIRSTRDLVVAIRVVESMDAAIAHVNRWGSHHTDAILTENKAAAARFMSEVDSAYGVPQLLDAVCGMDFGLGWGLRWGSVRASFMLAGRWGLRGW